MTDTLRVHRGSGGYDPDGGTPAMTPGPPIAGWKIAPRTRGSDSASSEINDRNRQGVIVGLTAYNHDPTVDVDAADKVEILDGLYAGTHQWEVEGEIGRWPMGVEMALRRSAG